MSHVVLSYKNIRLKTENIEILNREVKVNISRHDLLILEAEKTFSSCLGSLLLILSKDQVSCCCRRKQASHCELWQILLLQKDSRLRQKANITWFRLSVRVYLVMRISLSPAPLIPCLSVCFVWSNSMPGKIMSKCRAVGYQARQCVCVSPPNGNDRIVCSNKKPSLN